MNEILIQLNQINPIDFLGVNNQRFHFIKTKYPQIKILSRGTQLKLIGNNEETILLKRKIEFVISQLERNQFLSDEEFGEIFQSTDTILTKKTEKNALQSPTLSNQNILLMGANGQAIVAKTKSQQGMIDRIAENDILFAIGPAGTGKTYTAVALAVQSLREKRIKKIILTRPAVEAGESLGYLPGDLKEKIDPYLRPLYDALQDMIPQEKLTHYMNTNVIEVAPLAYMRGRTLNNAFLILDEAQNATEMQLKMFLTRIGPNAKAVITGDITQIDLPFNQKSGLSSTIELLKKIPGISTVNLDKEDGLRNKLVIKILQAYEKKNISSQKEKKPS